MNINDRTTQYQNFEHRSSINQRFSDVWNFDLKMGQSTLTFLLFKENSQTNTNDHKN